LELSRHDRKQPSKRGGETNVKVDTILVPTDFSSDAEKALETATDLAKQFGAKLVLLHAYHIEVPLAYAGFEGGVVLPPTFQQEVSDAASKRVQELAKTAAASGVEARGIAVSEPPSIAIVAEAEELPADLIVIGTRGLTGLKHVVLGSVAERVVRHAPCPVLTVKGDD
jgi:universal stress protein A